MSQRNQLTLLVSPLALVAFGGALAAGCGSDGGGGLIPGGGDCTTIGARVEAMNDGALKLVALANSVKVDVAAACADLAGMEAPADPTDEQVTSLCNAATARIDAAVMGSASLQVVVSPPVCTVNAEAQLSCEADCYASAEVQCDPGSIEARCEPGELSVECNGTCEVNAVCEGSLDVAVECEGKCEGRCEGTCSGSCTGTCMGTCNGTCEGTCSAMGTNGECEGTCDGTCTGSCDAECQGSCDASCEGECRGSCTIEADGGIECSGGARCKGECTGTATAPRCEAEITPPECTGEVEAACNGDCEGSASFDAQCTEAQIEIIGEIEGDATLRADLEASLPTLVVAAKKSGQAFLAAGDYSLRAIGVGAQALNCVVELGAGVAADFKAQMDATASAAASVNVSFEASASVSASATGGAG